MRKKGDMNTEQGEVKNPVILDFNYRYEYELYFLRFARTPDKLFRVAIKWIL